MLRPSFGREQSDVLRVCGGREDLSRQGEQESEENTPDGKLHILMAFGNVRLSCRVLGLTGGGAERETGGEREKKSREGEERNREGRGVV